MKAILLTILLISTFITAKAQEQGKYFFTKSGHVEYELTGNTTGKKTIWFDDFGIKTSTLYEGTTTTSFLGIVQTTAEKKLEIRNGNILWIINLLDKTGTKTTINYAIKTGKSLTDGKSDAELHATERKVITDMGGNISGYENILGKKCLVFTFGTTKFWQYKGIPLKSIVTLAGMLSNNETASVFQENIVVPSNKFDIPAGISNTEEANPFDSGLNGLLNEMGGLSGNSDDDLQELEYEEPLHTDLTYAQYLAAINNVKLQVFKVLISEESKSSYISLFSLNNKMGGISIMNTDLYDTAEQGEDIEVVKTYTLNGKPAKYAYTHEGETQMHVLFVKYPARKMTLMIHSERTLPLGTLEEMARQLSF